jgi:hypothetical protein
MFHKPPLDVSTTGAHAVSEPDEIDRAVASLLDMLSKHPESAATL